MTIEQIEQGNKKHFPLYHDGLDTDVIAAMGASGLSDQQMQVLYHDELTVYFIADRPPSYNTWLREHFRLGSLVPISIEYVLEVFEATSPPYDPHRRTMQTTGTVAI